MFLLMMIDKEKLIKDLKKNNPYVDMSIFKSVHNVNLSNIVGFRDKDGGKLYKFTENYDEKIIF